MAAPREEASWTVHRDGRHGFTLSYPAAWVTREHIKEADLLSHGAVFMAASPEGDLLFEVYSLKLNPLRLYLDLYQDLSRKQHRNTRVVGQSSYPLASGQHCVRITITDIERTVLSTSAEFTTDYFLIDAGTKVLSLNFKVLTSNYPAYEARFRRIVEDLKLEE